MQLEKPTIQKPKRVYVTCSDADNDLPSRNITIYEATPDDVIKLLSRAIAPAPQTRKPNRAASAS